MYAKSQSRSISLVGEGIPILPPPGKLNIVIRVLSLRLSVIRSEPYAANPEI